MDVKRPAQSILRQGLTSYKFHKTIVTVGQALSEAVPALLRGELARRKIRHSAFAAKLGVSDVWLWRRLNGRVQMTLKDVDRMADALQADPGELVSVAAHGADGTPTKTDPSRVTGRGPQTQSLSSAKE